MDTPAASIEIISVFILILANGFFVLAETAIIQSRKAKLERLADSGGKKAKLALGLVEDPSHVLAAIQIGITLMGILIGSLAGVEISPILANHLRAFPFMQGYADLVSVLLCVTSIMYLTLILGEFVPQKAALNAPEPIVVRLAALLCFLEKCGRPFVAFLSGSTNFALLFLGIDPKKTNSVTEEEVRTLIEQGTEEGTFEKTEQDMVDRIFRLSDQNANALMTPRTQMLWLDLEDPLEYNLSIIRENPNTIFPVGRDNLDDFSGILYAKDLLNLLLENKKISAAELEKAIRTPMFIPKSMHSFTVLENFKSSGTHEAIVLDEFGGVIGFITMTDIITEVVGDISSTHAPDPAQIIQRDDSSWLVDGLLSIDDFKAHFNLEELPEEDRDHYQTMGGFITSYLGYIPMASEKFKWNDLTFEVVDMDRVRVDKILVTREDERKQEELDNIAS